MKHYLPEMGEEPRSKSSHGLIAKDTDVYFNTKVVLIG